jgi:hypothetical protein
VPTSVVNRQVLDGPAFKAKLAALAARASG